MTDTTANTDGIEWDSEVKYHGETEEGKRAASGELTVDGPAGRLIVSKQWVGRVGGTDARGRPQGSVIECSANFYRAGDVEPIDAAQFQWQVLKGVIENREGFLEECRMGLEADPQVEYETYKESLQEAENDAR